MDHESWFAVATHEHLPCQTTSESLMWYLSNKVDSFSKNYPHTHMQMRLDMTVKCPRSRIISHKPQRRPPIGEYHCSVPERWVSEVEVIFLLIGKPPFSISQHPEIMPMEVPRVDLASVFRQSVSILKYHIHSGIEI